MMTERYKPPTDIVPADGTTTVLQLTDLHLFEDCQKTAQAASCQQHFESILNQALAEALRCDLILVTGDLVNEVKSSIYDRIFDRLTRTGLPFACVAGNHDVTDETNTDLPFEQRALIARASDPRLVEQHVIDTPDWQVLLINSTIPGVVAGLISADNIEWLRRQLSRCDKPALLALHHHVLPMQSAWIDAHMAQDAEEMWKMLSEFPHLKIIINGHSHQEQTLHHQGVTVYTTPSTSYQFKPRCDEFAYDEQARPGYRWLQLGPNGQSKSWVKRLTE